MGKKILLIAMMAHEINRAYCQATGDNSQPEWDEAPDWQKESAIKGVEFTLSNPDGTPEQSHESWLTEKQATGWKYGPVKNPETKEHPCFVPYQELPVEQRAKDYLFRAAVLNAAKIVGQQPEEEDVVQYAETLYNVYGRATNFKNFQGNPMPDYSQLPDGVVKAWQAVAEYTAPIKTVKARDEQA